MACAPLARWLMAILLLSYTTSIHATLDNDFRQNTPFSSLQSRSVTCNDGYYSSSGACVACDAGTFTNSSTGWSSCATCPAGYYSSQAASTCTICAAGTFSSTSKSATCTSCASTDYQPLTGQTTCLICSSPRTRFSSSTCQCGDAQTFDTTTSTCVTLAATRSTLIISSVFSAIASIGLIFAIIAFRSWYKTRRPFHSILLVPRKASVASSQMMSVKALANNPILKDTSKPEAHSPEAPIKKVFDILQSLKSGFHNVSLNTELDRVMSILAAGDVYNTTFEDLPQGEMDDDVKDWISTTVMGKRPSSTANSQMVGTTGRSRQASTARMRSTQYAAYMSTDVTTAIHYIAKDVFTMEINIVSAILEQLERSTTWNFDMFSFADITNGHPLLFLSYYIIKKLQILPEKVNEISLLQYLDEIEMTYLDNPYHNSIHAADMLQAVWVFLQDERIRGIYSQIELFATVIACAIHDVDHPGVSNAFLIKSRNPLALLYSDTSVLEFHHASTGFTIAERRQVFNGMGLQYDDLRKIIIDIVMATDMAKHFEYLNRFKSQLSTLVESPKEKCFEKPETKMLMLHIIAKCGDLNNPTRTKATSSEWTSRIMEEFYCQGDAERSLGHPISKFMDRTTKADENVAKCQSSFIDVIVSPLFQAWTSCLSSTNASNIITNLQINRQFWAQVLLPREGNSGSSSKTLRKSRTERSASFAGSTQAAQMPESASASAIAPLAPSKSSIFDRACIQEHTELTNGSASFRNSSNSSRGHDSLVLQSIDGTNSNFGGSHIRRSPTSSFSRNTRRCSIPTEKISSGAVSTLPPTNPLANFGSRNVDSPRRGSASLQSLRQLPVVRSGMTIDSSAIPEELETSNSNHLLNLS